MSGSQLDYFLEKPWLIRVAETELSLGQIIGPVIHGISTYLQRNSQIKGPETIEALLDLLEAFPHYWSKRSSKTRPELQGQTDSQSCNSDVRTPQLEVSTNIRLHASDSGPGYALQSSTLQTQTNGTKASVCSTETERDRLTDFLKFTSQTTWSEEQNQRALVQSRASISILKKSRANAEDVFTGRSMIVPGYVGGENDAAEWIRLRLNISLTTRKFSP